MAKDDQQEAFEKLMSANLARVVDFIKFAETKNAALLTFSSAWILATLNILSSNKPLPTGYPLALAVAIPLFLTAALISITSFAPRIKLSLFDKSQGRAKNLLFFGDIADLGIAAFKEQANTRYFPGADQSTTDDYLHDLMAQVAVNSDIANRKFRLFNWGSRVVLLALLVLLAPTVLRVGCWAWGAIQ